MLGSSDLSLSRDGGKKKAAGKVHLQPMANAPEPIKKQISSSSLAIPRPGHRVGSLEKIENPPHLTKLQPLGAVGNGRIDFSFKATLVLEPSERDNTN